MLTHAFVSVVPDDANPDLVQPSHWNAECIKANNDTQVCRLRADWVDGRLAERWPTGR